MAKKSTPPTAKTKTVVTKVVTKTPATATATPAKTPSATPRPVVPVATTPVVPSTATAPASPPRVPPTVVPVVTTPSPAPRMSWYTKLNKTVILSIIAFCVVGTAWWMWLDYKERLAKVPPTDQKIVDAESPAKLATITPQRVVHEFVFKTVSENHVVGVTRPTTQPATVIQDVQAVTAPLSRSSVGIVTNVTIPPVIVYKYDDNRKASTAPYSDLAKDLVRSRSPVTVSGRNNVVVGGDNNSVTIDRSDRSVKNYYSKPTVSPAPLPVPAPATPHSVAPPTPTRYVAPTVQVQQPVVYYQQPVVYQQPLVYYQPAVTYYRQPVYRSMHYRQPSHSFGFSYSSRSYSHGRSIGGAICRR